MISRQNKELKVRRFAASVATSQAVIVAQNNGLRVADLMALRQRLREIDARAQVVKNTLAMLVLRETPFKDINAHLSGPLIYGTGPDPVALARVFVNEAKANPKFLVHRGVLPESVALDSEGVTALSTLPSRDQLLAIVAAAVRAPLDSLARTLSEVPASLARALSRVHERKS